MTRQRTDARERPPEAGKFGLMPCAWESDAARCQLIADGVIRGSGAARHGFCAWHEACLENPRITDDVEIFEDWLNWLAAYCCTWMHYPSSYLWELTHGRTPPYRLPDPCRLAGCRYRSFPSGLPAPGEFRALIAQLSRRFDTLERRRSGPVPEGRGV